MQPVEAAGGAVSGAPRLWLRAEGLAVLALAALLYARADYPWILFAALFLVPDLSFAGYAAGPRIGAAAYNALHSYLGPVLLAGALILSGRPASLPLIWLAHVGFDRTLGYGLKYPSAFGDTHLGKIGRSGDGVSG